MKSNLDKLTGHRTFILACVIMIPFTVKGLFFAEGTELAEILRFIGGMARDVFIGLGASKVGDAAIRYSSSSTTTERIEPVRMPEQHGHGVDPTGPERRQFGAYSPADPAGSRATPDSPD